MTNRAPEQWTEVVELSREELVAVNGGDVVPTDTFSLNFAVIKFEYRPQKDD